MADKSRSSPEPLSPDRPDAPRPDGAGGDLDITRDSDVPISTQLYWQLAYQIDTGRLHAGARLPTVRELGGVLRVNPNTVRAVYRRLAEAGYIVSRAGAGTRVAHRGGQRRTSEALEGLVAEFLRRTARAGFTADVVASAVYAAASERKRPGVHVHVLYVECTSAEARVGAERIAATFPDAVDADSVLIDRVPDRLGRFHYDIVATTTFHADETKSLVGGRAPVIAMLASPSYAELLDEVRALPPGSLVGLVCASERGTANMADWLDRSGSSGVTLRDAVIGDEAALDEVDRDADLVLLSQEALEVGLSTRFDRPERIREWTVELDSAGLELLRRAIERVQATRAREIARAARERA